MNFRDVGTELELVGGIREHIRHPLTCKWNGHNIDVSQEKKNCFLYALFITVASALALLSLKRGAYAKFHTRTFVVISCGIFCLTYLRATLAKKIKAIQTGKETKGKLEDLPPVAHLAASNPETDVSVLENIIKKDLDALNQQDKEGLTPLHYAVSGPLNPLAVEKLLSLGADVNRVTKEGHTPLDFICQKRWNSNYEEFKDYTIDKLYEKIAIIIVALLNKPAEFSKAPLSINLQFLQSNYYLRDGNLIELYELALSKPAQDKIIHECCYERPKLVKWLTEEAKIPNVFLKQPKFAYLIKKIAVIKAKRGESDPEVIALIKKARDLMPADIKTLPEDIRKLVQEITDEVRLADVASEVSKGMPDISMFKKQILMHKIALESERGQVVITKSQYNEWLKELKDLKEPT